MEVLTESNADKKRLLTSKNQTKAVDSSQQNQTKRPFRSDFRRLRPLRMRGLKGGFPVYKIKYFFLIFLILLRRKGG